MNERTKQIIEQLRSGDSVVTVAAAFGVTKQYVSAVAKRHGVAINDTRSQSRPGRAVTIDGVSYASLTEAARVLGVSPAAIHTRAERRRGAFVDDRPRSGRPSGKRSHLPQASWDAIIIAVERDGLSYRAAAKQHGVSEQTVSYILKHRTRKA